MHVFLCLCAEVPDAPEPPKPDRVTKDSVTLSWRPPRSDGGKKIKEYVIEKKKKGDNDWSPAGESPGNNTVHTVSSRITCINGDALMKIETPCRFFC